MKKMVEFRTGNMKLLLLNTLQQFSLLFPLKFLIFLSGKKVLLPFYHTVSNRTLTHLKHLYKQKNEKEFEADLNFLLKYFQPVSLNELLETTNKQPTKNIFHLTFDDGLSEFYHVAAPILKRKGIPATVFLNSDFVDNKELFFRYKVSLLIEAFFQQKEKKQLIAEIFQKFHFQTNDILKAFHSINYLNKSVITPLSELLEIDFENYLESQQPYLTTSQIEELKAQGFTFGAHSCNHPEYYLLSFEEQLQQTIQSVHFVTNTFELPYKVFSFPFTDFNITDRFFKTIEKQKITDLSFGTAGLKNEIYKTHFQRIPLEMKNLNVAAENIIKREYFYYLLKIPFGKNWYRRK